MGSKTTTGEPRKLHLTPEQYEEVQRRLSEVVRAAVQGRIHPDVMQALASGRRVEIAPIRVLRDLLDQPEGTVTVGVVKDLLNRMKMEEFLDQYDGLTLSEHSSLAEFLCENNVFWRMAQADTSGEHTEDPSAWQKSPIAQCARWSTFVHEKWIEIFQPSDHCIASISAHWMPNGHYARRCDGEMMFVVPALWQFGGGEIDSLLPFAIARLLDALRKTYGDRFNVPPDLFGPGGTFRISPKVRAMYGRYNRIGTNYYTMNIQTGMRYGNVSPYRARYRMQPHEVPMDPFVGLALALMIPERFDEKVMLAMDMPGAFYTPPPGFGRGEGVLRLRSSGDQIDLNLADPGNPYEYAGSGSVLFPVGEPVIP